MSELEEALGIIASEPCVAQRGEGLGQGHKLHQSRSLDWGSICSCAVAQTPVPSSSHGRVLSSLGSLAWRMSWRGRQAELPVLGLQVLMLRMLGTTCCCRT